MKVGDKVIHIDCKGRIANPEFEDYTKLIKGNIYVIEKIIWYPQWGTETGLRLIGGYTVYDLRTGIELGWNSRAFRKLEENKDKNKQIDFCVNPQEQTGVSTSCEKLSNPS